MAESAATCKGFYGKGKRPLIVSWLRGQKPGPSEEGAALPSFLSFSIGLTLLSVQLPSQVPIFRLVVLLTFGEKGPISTPMLSDLNPLLLDLTGLDDAAIETLGIRTFSDIYLQTFQRGIHKAHDGESVYFYRSASIRHALHKTVEGKKNLDAICPERVRRIKWVKEFISGNVDGSECWLVPDARGYDKRLYCSFEHLYVIWLMPRDEGGWSFKSSYPVATKKTIAKYIQSEGAQFVCRFTETVSAIEPPQPSSQSDSASSPTGASPVSVPPCSLPDGLVPAREDSSLAAVSSPPDQS